MGTQRLFDTAVPSYLWSCTYSGCCFHCSFDTSSPFSVRTGHIHFAHSVFRSEESLFAPACRRMSVKDGTDFFHHDGISSNTRIPSWEHRHLNNERICRTSSFPASVFCRQGSTVQLFTSFILHSNYTRTAERAEGRFTGHRNGRPSQSM